MVAGESEALTAILLSSSLGEGPHPLASGTALAQGRPIDAHILALVHEDKSAALDVLYRTYKDRIYTFLLRVSGDAHLADDLTQDTFLKADRALVRLDGDRALLPWLYRIASNGAIDELRRRRRINWLRWPSLMGTRHEHAPDEHARVPERQQISLAMAAVPPENAAALLLHVVEGYSYREIAEIQGVTLTAARSRIARGREAFRQAYRGASAPSDK